MEIDMANYFNKDLVTLGMLRWEMNSIVSVGSFCVQDNLL